MTTTSWLCALLVTIATFAGATGAGAAEIKVLSAGAVRGIVTTLADAFRQETGLTVTISAGTVGVGRQKLAAGEPADVVIVSDTAIDARQGRHRRPGKSR